MLLAEKLQSIQEQEHDYDVDHAHLYISMVRFHKRTLAKEGTFYLQTLVSALTPKGNIYRYMGLQAERRRNTADLWWQMEELADTYKDLLGGSDTPMKQRTAMLRTALEKHVVSGAPDARKDGKDSLGFCPVDEFLFTTATNYCGVIVPDNAKQRRQWITNLCLVFLVFMIQILVPTVVLIEKWHAPGNHLRDADLWGHLKFRELLCLGDDMEGVMHTIVGVLLMELVLVIVLSYISEQNNNSQKSACVPSDRTYFLIGNFANIWCNLVTVLLLPMLFWTEDEATNIALDSLTLLFVQTLDDFAGYACQYMGGSDDEYAMSATWQMAMLSQCPVSLKDIVNPRAKNVDEIWSIRFDNDKLQVAFPEGGEPKACERRLQRHNLETSPLVEGSSGSFLYRATRTKQEVLPRPEGLVIPALWNVAWYFVCVCLLIVPVFWMMVNRHCAK
mmetsp:Transcript_32007/g.75027  ORF Transcript_32007/g.75027 Transcript_32007/m.75027 type:complete len:446 (-) Transcript_32007:134-1471(-)